MRVLMLAPIEQGSGETITCLHLAERLHQRGDAVRLLGSPFACAFLEKHFPREVRTLGDDGRLNRALWDSQIAEFRPDAVVFADYPMLFIRHGVTPLAREPGWRESLDELDARLVTLDHFGFAQRAMGLFLGPPHLSLQFHSFPAIPERMQILLPCPMHEPGRLEWRRGEPFRHWQVPIRRPAAARTAVRQRYLDGDGGYLLFHSVPNWACRHVDASGLALYRHLPQLLDHYLGDLPRAVTVVSVNNGELLETSPALRIRVLNLGPIPKTEFEDLLFGSDLVITENGLSISMGKAICGLQACAVLKNSYGMLELSERADPEVRRLVLAMEEDQMGTVFPYLVYPSGMLDVMDEIQLYRDNSITGAHRALELFGGEQTRQALHRLLTDDAERAALRRSQRTYVRRLARLGDGAEVLHRLVERQEAGA